MSKGKLRIRVFSAYLLSSSMFFLLSCSPTVTEESIDANAKALTPKSVTKAANESSTSSLESTLAMLRIEGCSVTYDGKALDFSQSIDTWIPAIGEPRKTSTSSSTWVADDIGFKLLVQPSSQKVTSLSLVLYEGTPFAADEVTQSALGRVKQEANQAHPRSHYKPAIWFNGAHIQKPFNLQRVNQKILDYTGASDIRFGSTYAEHVIAAAVKCPLAKYPQYQGKEMVFVIDTQPHDSTQILMFSIGIELQ